jgi:hypothetical protein
MLLQVLNFARISHEFRDVILRNMIQKLLICVSVIVTKGTSDDNYCIFGVKVIYNNNNITKLQNVTPF